MNKLIEQELREQNIDIKLLFYLRELTERIEDLEEKVKRLEK